MKPEPKIAATQWYALAFGLFLGLCIWKFGNPVILDHKIEPPATLSDFLNDAWPTHWANWIFPPLAAWGAVLLLSRNPRKADHASRITHHIDQPSRNPPIQPPAVASPWTSPWLWLLPLIWLAWQFISATQTVDAGLTTATLWQYSGCVTCYFLGALLIGAPSFASARPRVSEQTAPPLAKKSKSSPQPGTTPAAPASRHAISFLLIGILVAFAFCLVRGVNQRLIEYPENYQALVEGEHSGWTNFPPATVADMKNEGIILTTNGMDVANPVILAKFAKGRVCGTLVYPNALAEIILLLWPASLVLAFGSTAQLRPYIRKAAIALTLFLGAAAFFWTGSKLGWLIAIGLAGIVLLRLNWSKQLKFTAMAAVLVLGLGIFAVRFHHYFAAGATSAGARFDYWHAAVQTTGAKPLFGTGPGTFQRPYARLKSPESEMARLAHNDYLEQFSDSGIPGGLAYTAWILLALTVLGRKLWSTAGHFSFALFLGLLGWFLQGLGEFGLFVPALAWTAFTLLGCLIARGQ